MLEPLVLHAVALTMWHERTRDGTKVAECWQPALVEGAQGARVVWRDRAGRCPSWIGLTVQMDVVWKAIYLLPKSTLVCFPILNAKPVSSYPRPEHQPSISSRQRNQSLCSPSWSSSSS